jgi:diguanylate cyclase (GGDEF)-like protein/PAS domain S-box-containing protein
VAVPDVDAPGPGHDVLFDVQTLLAHSSDLIAVVKEDGVVAYVSPGSSRLLGIAPGDIVGRNNVHLIHRDDANILANPMRPGVPSSPAVVRLRHADGVFRTFEAVLTDLRDDPTIAGVLINARDITERVRAEAELRRNREMEAIARQISARFAMGSVEATPALLQDALDDLLHFTDATRTGIMVSDGALHELIETYGAAQTGQRVLVDRATPLSIRFLTEVSPDLAGGDVVTQYAGDADRRLIDAIELADVDPIQGIVYVPLRVSEDLLGVMVLSSIQPSWRCPDDTHGLLRIVAEICAGALARQRAERALAERALRDPLTQMPNRRLLMERLDHALSRMARVNSAVGLLFIDCDNFKDINDTLGHHHGDDLLVALGQRLKLLCRSGETVARLGGDEFVVLAESEGHESALSSLGDRIIEAMSEPYECGGRSVHITVSVGLAAHTAAMTPVDATVLLRRADTAMYRAKTLGRNRLAVFSLDMETGRRERYELAGHLRQAVRRSDSFEVWYQPMFRLADDSLSGCEALVRWKHADRGLLFPADFIDLAEESGLLPQLGAHVLERTLHDFDDWRRRGVVDTWASVAVNLSTRQLVAKSMVADMKALLLSSSVPPSQLIVEVTESVMADRVQVLPRLTELRDLGIQIAIDDFGTGYSSFAYLRDLPVDILKIDRSFVSGLGSNERDEAIVQTLVTLAERFSLSVIAEGVETPEQLESLRRVGCGQAQGYLLGRPAPRESAVFRIDGSLSGVVAPVTGSGSVVG